MLSKEVYLKALEQFEFTKDWHKTTPYSEYGSYKVRFEKKGQLHLFCRDGVVYFKDGTTTASQAYFEAYNNSQKDTGIVNKKPEPVPVPCYDIDEYVAKKYLQLKASATKRNKEFDLTLAVVRKLVKTKKCYYTGMPVASYEDYTHPNQLTIDRVDATLGYTKDNVVVCSHLANQFKNKIEHDFVVFFH